jgi:Co-chaperonin GroES (HSP10)
MPIKKMLNDNVLVKEINKKEKVTEGGIIIIDSATTKSTRDVEIVQLPDGVEGYGAGDIVHIGLYAGIDCTIDGESFMIVKLLDLILVE